MSWGGGVLRIIVVLAGAAMLLSAATTALAGVHDGGVASCSYCHSMHSAQSAGGPGGGGGGGQPGGGALLDGGPSSNICLNCHASAYGEVLGISPLAPPPERGPGNFVFLLADNLNDGPDGATNPIPGDAAGHNVRAPAYGLSTDGTHMTSPGGTYPANNLRCTSCHDPHGNENYRFLRGPGVQQGSGGNFSYPAPTAVGLDLEFGGAESATNHVAYQAGMSLWCANCHAGYLTDHNAGAGGWNHPTDQVLEFDEYTQYNLYNGTADPVGGNATASYLASVPFEDGAMTIAATWGPGPSSRLMCLSCHRAHASSAPHAGRWDFNVETLGQDGVISGSYPLPNPYLDPLQDPLCWKCHDGGVSAKSAQLPARTSTLPGSSSP